MLNSDNLYRTLSSQFPHNYSIFVDLYSFQSATRIVNRFHQTDDKSNSRRAILQVVSINRDVRWVAIINYRPDPHRTSDNSPI